MSITPPPVPVEHTIDEYAKALLHIVVVVLAAVDSAIPELRSPL